MFPCKDYVPSHFCAVGKGSLGPKAAYLHLHEVKDHQVRKPHL